MTHISSTLICLHTRDYIDILTHWDVTQVKVINPVKRRSCLTNFQWTAAGLDISKDDAYGICSTDVQVISPSLFSGSSPSKYPLYSHLQELRHWLKRNVKAVKANCEQQNVWNVSEQKDCYSDTEVCEQNEVSYGPVALWRCECNTRAQCSLF